jgi:hypothetical protein
MDDEQEYKEMMSDLRYQQLCQMIVTFTFNQNGFLLNALILPWIILMPHYVLFSQHELYNSRVVFREFVSFYFLTMLIYLHQLSVSKLVI